MTSQYGAGPTLPLGYGSETGTFVAGVAFSGTRHADPSHTLTTKDELYAEYAGYHCDIRNWRAHSVGIPLIVLGLLGLFSLLRLGPVDPAVAAAVAVLFYYATIDVRGAFISAIAFALLYGPATHLPWEVNVGAFILWVGLSTRRSPLGRQ
jgi:hypothetical protein